MTNDEIIDIRDSLITRKPLTEHEQNLLRDCDIALGLVRCTPLALREARERVIQSGMENKQP